MKILFCVCIYTRVQGRRETATKTFALKIQIFSHCLGCSFVLKPILSITIMPVTL